MATNKERIEALEAEIQSLRIEISALRFNQGPYVLPQAPPYPYPYPPNVWYSTNNGSGIGPDRGLATSSTGEIQ